MSHRTRYLSYLAAAAVALFAVTSAAHAGGPLALCQDGQPYLYPNGGVNIPYNPDQGYLGPLDNAAAVAQTEIAFATWETVSTSTASFFNAGPLPEDVNFDTFYYWLYLSPPDGISPIVYDEDGSIFEWLFGYGSGVLGFSGPEWGYIPTCEIMESLSFLNGGEYYFALPYSTDEFACVQHHEFGHFTNLAHTVVNEQIGAFWDYTGPEPYDTFGWPVDLVGKIETMSPYILIGGGQCDPHKDDAMALSDLYPAPGYAGSTGSITGRIYGPNGTTQLTGVNVIARNVLDPFDDAVSALSSDYTDSTLQSNPYVGLYTLNNLTPGADYALYVDGIMAGGFSTDPMGPCYLCPPLPGPEEFYNGANESSDPAVDDPSVYTTVAAAAGAQVSGVDIIFNRPGPGDPLPIGDDDSIELFMPFTFEFCGEGYDSLFVNSNGSITFGSGDTDFGESAAEMLGDQPRIAGLWDDLNPTAGGMVTFYQTSNEFTVSFQDVPEYYSTGANSFDIILSRSSGQVDIQYGSLTAADGLAGLSCGGSKTTGGEAESDLSEDQANATEGSINARNVAAWYELFSGYDGDLSGLSLRFNVPNEFKDLFEKNDSPGQATSVSLPFNTSDPKGDSMILQYTDIFPVGDDVDFFKFQADAGKTLVAEVVAGDLDTVIGLFDDSGTLIAYNDDGGAGLLSKLQVPIGASGAYYLAVTTYPDFDFSGDGNSGSRYVLDAEAIAGFVLDLGDDDYEEVPIGFTFPFQGGGYTSVFVNSNGSLTFGAGSTDWSESVSELLSGPPRIAPLWDDLAPNRGGQVLVESDATSFTVTFDAVPEYYNTGANTFSVTLHASGEITVEYGTTNGSDGIVGITEGGGAADPGEVDLSTAGTWPGTGTTYEQFGSPDYFDLDLATLTFLP